jgi:hypothetical protein
MIDNNLHKLLDKKFIGESNLIIKVKKMIKLLMLVNFLV